jgi:signal transduction histidine kinase
MRPELLDTIKRNTSHALHRLGWAFDKTASWVTQLSWWKFFLFAILLLIAGKIMENTLFSSESRHVVVKNKNTPSTIISDEDADIRIDSSGIHIHKNGPKNKNAEAGADAADEEDSGNTSQPSQSSQPPQPSQPSQPPRPPKPPQPPQPPRAGNATGSEVHIDLPPDIGKEVSDAIQEAVQDAAEEKAAAYRKKSSTWFMNFILLLLVGLFGTKALMGGKKRAEARASVASANAEREQLKRQVVEAKMQMMQAQVEPHFLFNTLASVEHLIETNPPRAAAMQRTLIQYLRAVLPQMRETPTTTRLGREVDIVKAYLELLKMRMEERLTVDLNVPGQLRDAVFPPMMLQSLVENSIKHGLESKPEGGTLRVFAEVTGNKLRVSVADNGLGFGAVQSNGTGLGLQNIRERLKLLFGDQAQLIIVPNSPSGVCATIEVPYQSH